MPSKKQRRRREKLKRHQYELVQVDAEGNEVPLEGPVQKKSEPDGKAAAPRRGRAPREVKPPSWTRSGKRAVIFVPFLFIFLSIGKNPPPIAARLGISLLYAVVFVPMFFFVDRLAYRGYKRRLGG
jgi:hypothetical protein